VLVSRLKWGGVHRNSPTLSARGGGTTDCKSHWSYIDNTIVTQRFCDHRSSCSRFVVCLYWPYCVFRSDKPPGKQAAYTTGNNGLEWWLQVETAFFFRRCGAMLTPPGLSFGSSSYNRGQPMPASWSGRPTVSVSFPALPRAGRGQSLGPRNTRDVIGRLTPPSGRQQ